MLITIGGGQGNEYGNEYGRVLSSSGGDMREDGNVASGDDDGGDELSKVGTRQVLADGILYILLRLTPV